MTIPSNKASFPSSTSTSLLRRAQAREAQAWEQLVQIYGPLVYYWCRQARLQPADASDVVQEVFRGVASGLTDFDHRGDGTFRGWLRTITHHKVADFARRIERHPPGHGGSSARAGFQQVQDLTEFSPDESAGESQRHERLHQAIEHLRAEIKDSTWQALWLTVVEGQEPAQVARELKMKVGTLYQAKSRALARLRQILAELPADSVG